MVPIQKDVCLHSIPVLKPISLDWLHCLVQLRDIIFEGPFGQPRLIAELGQDTMEICLKESMQRDSCLGSILCL